MGNQENLSNENVNELTLNDFGTSPDISIDTKTSSRIKTNLTGTSGMVQQNSKPLPIIKGKISNVIRSFFVHNFQSLVNFEVEFHDLTVIVGENGVGKTAAMKCLSLLVGLISSPVNVDAMFPSRYKTRWVKQDVCSLKLEVDLEDNYFTYQINIQYGSGPKKGAILSESLSHHGGPIFQSDNGNIRLFNEEHEEVSTFQFSTDVSAISVVSDGSQNSLLLNFRKAIQKIIYLQPNPFSMAIVSESESRTLDPDGGNLASWLRHIFSDLRLAFEVQHQLSLLLPNFKALRFVDLGGQRKLLELIFGSISDDIHYHFNELSEGQRIIVALVALTAYASSESAIIIFDEPDNYLAPSLVHRWFYNLQEKTYFEQNFQAIIISHHPQILRQLTMDNCLLFSIEDTGLTTVTELNETEELADIMARGWHNAEGD